MERGGLEAGPKQPECIVCREETGEALGYVGFGRRSLVLDVREEQEEERCPGVHLQFCGHALHYSCFDQYYVTLIHVSDMRNNVALDIKRGEFHCPLCKALSNLMVPAVVRPSPSEMASLMPGLEKEEGQEGYWWGGHKDAMEVSGDEQGMLPSGCRAKVGWLDQKAASALHRAISPVAAAAASSSSSALASASAADESSPSISPSPRVPSMKTVARMLSTRKGRLRLAAADESLSLTASSAAAAAARDQAVFQPPIKSFLESVYEVETGETAAGSHVLPEALFVRGCRALAFSVTSAAAASSPLESVRAGGSGAAFDVGDASRLRYLRKVAAALRKATGQAGVGPQVRRKLAVLLRGEEETASSGRRNALRGARGDGNSVDDGGAISRALPGTALEEANADFDATRRTLADEEGPVVQHPVPSLAEGRVWSEVMSEMRSAGAERRAEGGKEEAWDRPLVLTGAMEMLATALVALPPGDLKGATQCVGAFCLVRVLQVLSAYRLYQERPNNVAPMDVVGECRGGVGGRVAAMAAAGGGGKLGLEEEKEEKGMMVDDNGRDEFGAVATVAEVVALFQDGGVRRPAEEDKDQPTSLNNITTPEQGGNVVAVRGGDGYSRLSPTRRRSSPPPPLLAGGRRDVSHRMRSFSLRPTAPASCSSSNSSGGSGSSSSSGSSVKDPFAADTTKAGVSPAAAAAAVTGNVGPEADGDGNGSSGDVYARVAKEHVTAFLRTSLLMLHVCMGEVAGDDEGKEDAPQSSRSGGGGGGGVFSAGGLAAGGVALGADGSVLPASDDEFEPLCRYFGFPQTAEAMLCEPGIISAARRWISCGAGWTPLSQEHVVGLRPRLWLDCRKRAVMRRLCDFPLPVKVDLVQLPRAYTELHAQVSSIAGPACGHPAVCLVCGDVLDANGSGQCTKHAVACGSDMGLFFLLQECAILLIHGRRASYFASPYVDAYGERQRHTFGGRPLFLDERRYGVVRGLWRKHLVAHEVVQNRSSSRQVIRDYYY